jgi:hypothetical protein
MKRAAPFIAALAILLPAHTTATEPSWEPLASIDQSVLVEVDPASIARRDGRLTLWLRISFAGPVASRRLPFRSAVAEHAVDCAQRRHAVMRMTTYSGTLGEGDVVDRWDRSPQDWDWRSALGDAADAGIVALACAQAAATHLSMPITRSPP